MDMHTSFLHLMKAKKPGTGSVAVPHALKHSWVTVRICI